MLEIINGIYIKNGLLFKQKYERAQIHKYGDYFIHFNQLIRIYIYIDTHTCMYKILVSRKENIIE